MASTESNPEVPPDILFLIGKIDGKVDSILAALAQQGSTIAAVEARTSKLEQWKAYMIGAAVVAGGASGYLSEFLTK